MSEALLLLTPIIAEAMALAGVIYVANRTRPRKPPKKALPPAKDDAWEGVIRAMIEDVLEQDRRNSLELLERVEAIKKVVGRRPGRKWMRNHFDAIHDALEDREDRAS